MRTQSLIDERGIRRIEVALKLLADEIATLCTPSRESDFELRLSHSLIFGVFGEDAILLSIREERDHYGRRFTISVLDLTFEPGRNYGLMRVIPTDDDGPGGRRFAGALLLDGMRKEVVEGIREAVQPAADDEVDALH